LRNDVSGGPRLLGLSREFEPFLRSPLWTERNDMSLSVLSALARLDVDPWSEAATLAGLPRASASLRLAGFLNRLPGGPRPVGDVATLCDRSVSLLPAPHAPGSSAGAAEAARGPQATIVAGTLFFFAAAMAAVSLLTALGPRPGSAPTHSHPGTPAAAGRQGP
jgi:hypothetical protein